MLDTFENSSAERVLSECSQSRYIADIFNKDISRATPDILPIYFSGRRKLVEASRLVKEARRL